MTNHIETEIFFNNVSSMLNTVADELHNVSEAEGYPEMFLTGAIQVDHSSDRVWFEVLDDEVGIKSWVCVAGRNDSPAPGEKLLGAASLEEALMHP